MILLGISGKKKAGKDTLLSIIKLHTSLKVERLAFADSLKLEVAQACKVPVAEIEKNKDKFRTILQWWGTDFRRSKDDTYWTKQWLQRAVISTADILIAPDVRFDNEFQAIKGSDGIMIRVNRETSDLSDKHPSETELDNHKFDYTLQNTTIDAMHTFAKILLSRITNTP